MTARRRLAADLLAVCLLVALPWLLYRQALGLWWSEDDFFQLRFAVAHGPAGYGLDPDVWRRLPNQVLSPLLFASYDLDLALFGLEPRAFYAHQLLALGLAAVALFLALRLWLPVTWSLLGGALLLLGAPIASLAPLLMVRHYPEAILLGLLAAAAFGLAVRRRGGAAVGLAVLSGLAYLAASAAKEIAVPLPAVLALLPVGCARRRLLLLVPHGLVGCLYAVYRARMLETPLGGYGFTVVPGEWPRVVAALPLKVARELAGPSPWGWIALVALLAAAILHALRSRRAGVLAAAGLLLAWLPILPASVQMTPRLAASSWLVLAAAFAPAARALAGRPGRGAAGTLLVALVLGATIAGNRAAWGEQLGLAQRKSAENRGFLELSRPGDVLRHPTSSPAAMTELETFARAVLGRPARGGWFYDDLFLCGGSGGIPIRTLWAYDPGAEALVEITADLPRLRESHCSGIRWRAPLEARFHPRPGGVLTWELGPYPEERYSFVMEEGRLRYDMPRRGGFRLGWPQIELRLRYDSPAGWVTYSPPLAIPLRPGKPVAWRRGPAGPEDGSSRWTPRGAHP